MPSVGIVVVGHGATASSMVEAAQSIVGRPLDEMICVDSHTAGQSEELKNEMCQAIEAADQGLGVVMVVDLIGASPCRCGLREAQGRRLAVVSGLNVAMLLKLANLNRDGASPRELAVACADSGNRAITVVEEDKNK